MQTTTLPPGSTWAGAVAAGLQEVAQSGADGAGWWGCCRRQRWGLIRWPAGVGRVHVAGDVLTNSSRRGQVWWWKTVREDEVGMWCCRQLGLEEGDGGAGELEGCLGVAGWPVCGREKKEKKLVRSADPVRLNPCLPSSEVSNSDTDISLAS